MTSGQIELTNQLVKANYQLADGNESRQILPISKRNVRYLTLLELDKAIPFGRKIKKS